MNSYHVRWRDRGRSVEAWWTLEQLQDQLARFGDPGMEVLVPASYETGITERWISLQDLGRV